MNLDLRIVEASDAPGWDAFVAAHPKGSIFHSSGMISALGDAKNMEPYAFAAVDDNDAILAVLVAVRVLTLGKWAGSFSGRSIFHAEPICVTTPDGPKAIKALLEHHDRFMKTRVLFAEMRPLFSNDELNAEFESCGYQRLGYLNYELALQADEDKLWMNLNSKCRSDIRRSQNKGLVIRKGDRSTDLSLHYSHLMESYGRSNLPLADFSLFSSVVNSIPSSQFRLTVAEFDGVPVASASHLLFNNRIIYWYAGIIRTKGIAANSCLLWDTIRWGASQGMRTYDFAGAGWVNEDYGPGKFKSQFGGQLTNFGRYRKVYSPVKLQLAESVYGKARKLLSPGVRRQSAKQTQSQG